MHDKYGDFCRLAAERKNDWILANLTKCKPNLADMDRYEKVHHSTFNRQLGVGHVMGRLQVRFPTQKVRQLFSEGHLAIAFFKSRV